MKEWICPTCLEAHSQAAECLPDDLLARIERDSTELYLWKAEAKAWRAWYSAAEPTHGRTLSVNGEYWALCEAMDSTDRGLLDLKRF